jgi:hypothetical protein
MVTFFVRVQVGGHLGKGLDLEDYERAPHLPGCNNWSLGKAVGQIRVGLESSDL